MRALLSSFSLLGALSVSAMAQSGVSVPSTPRPFDPGQNSTNPSSVAVQSQNPYLGSVPRRPLTSGTLRLSLHQAVNLALEANLGHIEAEQDHAQSRAERLRALSQLLPQLSVDTTETYRNLISDSLGVPKVGLPVAIPAYNYQTAHINLEQRVLDLPATEELHAANHEMEASSANLLDARNIVVLAAVSSYLLAVASQTRLHTAEVQSRTAIAVDNLVADRVSHDLSPAIENTRTQVGRLSAELRVKLARISLAKDKLALTRIIGLPVEQDFVLTDELVYHAAPQLSESERVETAEQQRKDTRAAQARVEAAEDAMRAAKGEYLPRAEIQANAGETGFTYGSSRADYVVEGRIEIPVFTSGRIASDMRERSAALLRRKAELADVNERAKYEVHTALLDLDAAETSVQVADKNEQLAREALGQAERRFQAGVSNAVEYIEAQQAVADAEDNQIASLYAHQLAKLRLVRATGTAE